MNYFSWNPQYNVGISKIDEQHQNLVKMINEFYVNLTTKPKKENMSKLIKGLKDYTVYHFQTEENLMTLYHFDGMVGHKKEHQEFINQINDYYERFINDQLIISIEITNFLRDWLIRHINGSDQLFGEFLQQKGLH